MAWTWDDFNDTLYRGLLTQSMRNPNFDMNKINLFDTIVSGSQHAQLGFPGVPSLQPAKMPNQMNTVKKNSSMVQPTRTQPPASIGHHKKILEQYKLNNALIKRINNILHKSKGKNEPKRKKKKSKLHKPTKREQQFLEESSSDEESK